MRLPITHIFIRYEEDIVIVRNRAKEIAELAGLNLQDQTKFVTAVSEIARNAFHYAGGGKTFFELNTQNGQSFVQAVIKDEGPGIENLDTILNRDYKSKHGMGLGIIGSKKLVDYFDIQSSPGKGTTVTIGKLIPPSIPIDSNTVKEWIERFSQQKPESSYEEIRMHNEELITLLEELNRKEKQLQEQLEKLEEMNHELERTNAGIIALHTELKKKNLELEKTNKKLIEEIREREKAEKKLKESEKRYRVLVENINECIILVIEGKIVVTNPACSDILGYTKDELEGQNISDFISQNKKDKFFALLNKNKDNIIPINNMETRLKSKDSTEVDVELTVRKLSFLSDSTYLVVIRDISIRKLLEEERLKTKKLESLSILAGGFAHDFNNLLTAIIGNLSICKMKIKDKNELLNFIEGGERASLMAKDLVYKFLNISSDGKPVLQLQDIRDTIRATVESAFADTNIEYNLYIEDSLWQIPCDISQIQQVIFNILINAIEAVDGKEGKVEITAENITVEIDNKQGLAAGKYVMITISDNGRGIDGKYMEKIFDPYFSTKERATQKGMGLGLTLTYSIVRNHGGHIQINSRVGKGTSVILYFPAKNK